MEYNFKISVHATDLGEYKTDSALIEHIEDIIEASLEKQLKTETGVNVEHDEVPVAFFSCLFDKDDTEIKIPFSTSLRGKEAIGKYLADYGYAPSGYKLVNIYNITELEYIKYTKNRHVDDPLKTVLGSKMKYYKIMDSEGVLVTYIGSRREFKCDEAVLAYGIDMGKLTESTEYNINFDVPKEEYVEWKYNVGYAKKNVHYTVTQKFTDGRDNEILACLATKIKFENLDDVKSHMVEIGKITEDVFTDGAVLDKCAFSDYKNAKKTISEIKKSVKKLSDSDAEQHHYENAYDEDEEKFPVWDDSDDDD